MTDPTLYFSQRSYFMGMMLSFSSLTSISVTYVNKITRKKKKVTKRRRQKPHRQTILRSWWIIKSLVITGLSQISKLFLKLSRKLWLYVSKTTLNQINLMNLYYKRFIIAAVLYSWCLTCLLLLTLSTTIFCLKDLTLGFTFVVLLVTGFGRTLQTAHNLP